MKNESLVKMEPAGPEFTDIVKMKHDDLDVDLAKVCDDSDENSIFSACHSPDDVEDSTASELGEYELSYLHTIYHSSEAMLDEDAILPDAIAPPSLGSLGGLSMQSSTGAHIASISQPPSSKKPLSVNVEGRNGQPKGGQDAWDSEDETSEHCASPVPAGPAVKASPKTPINSRKRKASVISPVKVEASPKVSRVKGPVDKEDNKDDSDNEYGSDRGSSPCPSNTPMLDGLEIRPEDDPLGLFSKDPATLTPEEQRILKKQRRLLKNRESAQLSSHCKKMHLTSLERQVEALKKEKAALAARVTDLQDENERLRKQMITMP